MTEIGDGISWCHKEMNTLFFDTAYVTKRNKNDEGLDNFRKRNYKNAVCESRMMENSDQQEDPILRIPLSQEPPQLSVPQCVSTRRQPLVEFDPALQSTSSEDSNEHPFAPHISKPLPPKYLKPISPRRKGKVPTTPDKKESSANNEDPLSSGLASQNVTSVVSGKSHDSISTGDSGKSSLSDASGDYQGKDKNISPRKKQGKPKDKIEKKQVHIDEAALLRQHLMKVLTPRVDDSASIFSYLSSNIDFVPLDIVSLRSRKTDQDPFNTAYIETQLESLENIFFEDGVSFNRIFIQGTAGSGKSTLLQQIIKDWSKAREKGEKQGKELMTSYELFLANISLVFLVPLGKVADEKDIETFLAKYVVGKTCPINMQEIVKVIAEQRANCLYLLDGYDEYSDASSAVDNLIAGETFPNATIVLTSQRWKLLTPKISEIDHRLLEIKGFSDEQSRLFISKFIRSKKLGVTDVEIPESELWKYMESIENKLIMTTPQLLLFGCICFLENSSISANCSGLYKDLIQCLYDIYKREDAERGVTKLKEKHLETEQKHDPTLQALLVNIGKIAFRCLMARKQSPKRVPSHWFDQEMYRDYLLLGLELGLLQETKIVSKQKEIPVAAFVSKSMEEFLAAYYLCNVNDTNIVFHEQAAIIELINAGKIEKAFVYKFLDILIFAAGVNPVITCELLAILIPEMESDCIVMEKLNKCAEEMELMDGLNLPLMSLSFDRNISQTLIQLCRESLEYLTFVNCELGAPNSKDNLLTDRNEKLCRTFFAAAENLRNLKFLKLDHVSFRDRNLESIILPKLQELALRAVSPAGKCMDEILTEIKCPVLQEVTIDYCDFGDEVMCFPKLELLNTLTLGNIKLCPHGWKSLLQSFESFSILNSLTFSSLRILGDGVVFPRVKSLTKLELHEVEFDSENSCTAFYASFNNIRSLEVVEVSAMSVIKLIPHLDVLPNLNRVSLNDIVFSSEIAFPKSSISVLELNSLTFVGHCGQTFISSMHHLPNLATLTIRYCNFEKENINFLKLKSVKKLTVVNNLMTSNCWCVSVFSLGQLKNLETLEVIYRADEDTNVGELIKDMVDQRSPVPKIVSYTKSGKEKSVIVDFTNNESLMKTGSCCMQ